MKNYILSELDSEALDRLCRRPRLDYSAILQQIEPVLSNVESQGDAAIRHYTRKFDGIEPDEIYIDPMAVEVSLTDEVRKAIDTAIANVERFHIEQMTGDLEVQTMPGITCSRVCRPVERVGLYIPGGSAPLPSTAIMLGVPAAAAGCPTIVLATPPDQNGRVPDAVIYVARRIGAAGVLIAGGAQAIAALAWGTESVPAVDKIFGPGNQYVTAAKMALQNSGAMVSIDMPAGPSEVLVIAGPDADPDFVAADLLSQAEHGPDSQVVLVTLPGFDMAKLEQSLGQQLEQLPRSEIARQALRHSFSLAADRIEEAIAFSNRYAPEHLIINLEDATSWSDEIMHAGSVFLGPWTPESLGDYASGTNHTLPTYGYARMYSGVSLNSFQKSITFQEATRDGLLRLGPTVETLASLEGLEAHRKAVSIRRDKITSES